MDVLPSPVNLVKWWLKEAPDCKLCGGRGVLAHILSGCKIALQQGRYRWRHDQVLRELADVLAKERTRPRTKKKSHCISFIQAEGKTISTPSQIPSLLDGTTWEMRVDLGKQLVFPPIVQTTLRSVHRCDRANSTLGGGMWRSTSEKECLVYGELVDIANSGVGRLTYSQFEVGCRGIPAQWAWRLYRRLGIRGQQRRASVRRVGEQSERASCLL